MLPLRRLLFAAVLLPGVGWSATVSISCGAVGLELTICREGAEAWARETGNRVAVVSTPNSTTDRLALYQQLLAAQSPDIDIFQIDVIWPGILHRHFLDLSPYVEVHRLQAQFEVVVENNRVDGRLLALPWFVDAGLLYYRADLLQRYGRPVPQSWTELGETARIIQVRERAAGRPRVWGFVWQGRAYEGLTCNALEWIHSHNGGTIVADDGRITINNPRAAEALALAASWVGEITPIGVLNYDEEQARGVFQSGQAVFMRNWPYAWPLVNGEDSPVQGKVGIAPLPRGGAEGRHTGTLGGWSLAVSRYSRVPAEATDLVKYLTSRQEQKRRALIGGYNPTYRDLYESEAIESANPLTGELVAILEQAVARPSRITGVRYNQVSNAFWTAVHTTLSGKRDSASSLARLERRLQRLNGDGW